MPTFEEVCAVVDGEREHQGRRFPNREPGAARPPSDDGEWTLVRACLAAADMEWASDPEGGERAALVHLRKAAACLVRGLERPDWYGGRYAAYRKVRDHIEEGAASLPPPIEWRHVGRRCLPAVRGLPLEDWLTHFDRQWYQPWGWSLDGMAAALFACLMQHGAPPRAAAVDEG